MYYSVKKSMLVNFCASYTQIKNRRYMNPDELTNCLEYKLSGNNKK